MSATTEYFKAKPGVVIGVIMQLCGLLFDNSDIGACGAVIMAVFLAVSPVKREDLE